MTTTTVAKSKFNYMYNKFACQTLCSQIQYTSISIKVFPAIHDLSFMACDVWYCIMHHRSWTEATSIEIGNDVLFGMLISQNLTYIPFALAFLL